MGKWKDTGSDGYNKLLASGSFSQLYSSDFCQGQNRNQSKISQNMKQVSYHPILYVFRTPTQFILTSRICLWGMKLDFIHIVKCLMAQNNIRIDHERSDKLYRPEVKISSPLMTRGGQPCKQQNSAQGRPP